MSPNHLQFHLLYRSRWTNTQSKVFHVACGVQNNSQLLGPHSYCSQALYEKGKEIRCIWRLDISYGYNKCVHGVQG
jgi:hypothetical protein